MYKFKLSITMDHEDLDFGIYKIMNYKSKEINKFIDSIKYNIEENKINNEEKILFYNVFAHSGFDKNSVNIKNVKIIFEDKKDIHVKWFLNKKLNK